MPSSFPVDKFNRTEFALYRITTTSPTHPKIAVIKHAIDAARLVIVMMTGDEFGGNLGQNQKPIAWEG